MGPGSAHPGGRPIPRQASSRSPASPFSRHAGRIFGAAGQTRDFVYVADVVTALLATMRLAPADAPVFNVCTGVATSVLDLARDTFGLPEQVDLRNGLANVLDWLGGSD